MFQLLSWKGQNLGEKGSFPFQDLITDFRLADYFFLNSSEENIHK